MEHNELCIACEVEDRRKQGRKLTLLKKEDETHTCGRTLPHKDEVEGWGRRIDEELYFLSQDGYAPGWRESKAKDIKDIVREVLAHREESLRAALRKLPTYYINSEGNPAVLVESVEALLSDK